MRNKQAKKNSKISLIKNESSETQSVCKIDNLSFQVLKNWVSEILWKLHSDISNDEVLLLWTKLVLDFNLEICLLNIWEKIEPEGEWHEDDWMFNEA